MPCSADRLLSGIALMGVLCVGSSVASAQNTACPANTAGLRLPAGFCATVFADGIGHARHLVVAPNGVVYVNTWSGRYYGNQAPHAGGFLVALQDTAGTGTANVTQRFGETVQSGGAGGTGIGLYKGALYAEINDQIVRYTLAPGSIIPLERAQTIVSGLPLGGDHPMHPFAIDAEGQMYVDVATATNSCQPKNRKAGSAGADPCKELETRGGIWRYDANKTGQPFSPAERYATGIRNGEGFGVDSAGHHVFVTQHGRDQLHSNWPALYKPDEEATLPAEELLNLKPGSDYGWPECYYDPFQQKLVLAPEYGGDGGKKVGICVGKVAPVAAFPAHWAPDGMAFYDKDQFPARYRSGVFIAFHGSWNRAPYPQSGYNVVYQPLAGDRAGGKCEVFADGFAGSENVAGQSPASPDGHRGRTGRVPVCVGRCAGKNLQNRLPRRPRGRRRSPDHGLPERDCGRRRCQCRRCIAARGHPSRCRRSRQRNCRLRAHLTAALPVAKGATKEMVALGDKIYHGEVGGAACTGCHGAAATGTTLGPDLTGKNWLWSDGSVAGLTKTISEGVVQPKQYRSPMPPKGGAALSTDQVSAVAAYIWGLSHRSQ